MSDIIEEWRDIKGYEGIYQISNLGRVKSLPRIALRSDGKTSTVKAMIRKNTLTAEGYYTISLTVKARRLIKRIHVILAETFIPNPDNLPLVCHRDDVKTNLDLDNLYWGTYKDNMADSIRNGKYKAVNKTKR